VPEQKEFQPGRLGMPSQCVSCGTNLPQVAYFCPACGNPSGVAAGISSPPPWRDRLLAVVAYFTFVPAIVLVLLPRWKRHSFIRFHSYQSIFFCLACLILTLVLRLTDFALALLPRGLLLIFLAWGIITIAAGLLWLTLLIKALQGQWFSLPILGRIAVKTSHPGSQS
jgi:uncharacterized membrane protein